MFSFAVLLSTGRMLGRLVLGLALAPAIHAYPGYQQRIPNGDELRTGDHKYCPDEPRDGRQYTWFTDAIANKLWWAVPEARTKTNDCMIAPIEGEVDGDRKGKNIRERKDYNSNHRLVSGRKRGFCAIDVTRGCHGRHRGRRVHLTSDRPRK